MPICFDEAISLLLFLQLPEPVMPFRLYNALMGLAKESLQGGGEAKGKSGKGGPELVDKGTDTDKVVITLVLKLKELLKELPRENMATLQYIVKHLCRCGVWGLPGGWRGRKPPRMESPPPLWGACSSPLLPSSGEFFLMSNLSLPCCN